MKILVPLAEGFEEIEAVSIVDVLRRADFPVVTAAIGPNPVTGSHNITLTADTSFDEINPADFSHIVLPGGMPGSKNLRDDSRVISAVKKIYSAGGIAAAVCAAPIVLARAGLLKGKSATCFPGFESELEGALHTDDPVVQDGKIVTGKGAGCALPFALKIVEIISGAEKARELKNRLQIYWM